MDLRRQLAVLRAWARWIVVGAVLAAVAAFGLSQVLPKVYQADTRLLVGQALESSSPDVDQFQSAMNLAETYAEIARSRTLLDRVMAEVGISETIEEFAQRISVSTGDQQPFVDIVALGDSADEAAALADSVATQLLAIAATVGQEEDEVLAFVDDDLRAMQVQIQVIRPEIATLIEIANRTEAQEARLQTLENRLVNLRSIYASLLQLTARSQSNRLTVIDPAVPPVTAASPRPLLNTAIAAMLGLLVLIAFAFTWETLDDRLRTADDVERATGLSTIGVIMRMPGDRGRKAFYRLATLLYPRSPAAEAFRSLRTNLEFASLDQAMRTVVVTSSGPNEGKTVVTSNLAVAFAQSGKRVVLVDADLRRPSVHEMFGLRNERGLTDLARSDEIGLEEVKQATEEPNLMVITSGTLPANPAELLGSHRMQEVFDRIRAVCDLLIVDTAPVGAVTDAAVLATNADATVFVVRGKRTSERLARRGREALAKVNAHVVGAVLNDVELRASDAMPYYGLYVDDKATPVTPATGPGPVNAAGPATASATATTPAGRGRPNDPPVRTEPAAGGE